MVSNAREDLPDPERPVMTVSRFRGIATEMFLRLCSRAPRTRRYSSGIAGQRIRIGGRIQDGGPWAIVADRCVSRPNPAGVAIAYSLWPVACSFPLCAD